MNIENIHVLKIENTHRFLNIDFTHYILVECVTKIYVMP